MTDLPTIVYRCPGPYWGSLGTTYNSLGVYTQDAYDKALADGWSATMPEAIDAFLNPAPVRIMAAVPVNETFPDEAPPTRDEMMIKAAEIGLVVDKRWSDKTLAAKIIEALLAAEAARTAVPEPTPAPEPAPDPEPTP